MNYHKYKNLKGKIICTTEDINDMHTNTDIHDIRPTEPVGTNDNGTKPDKKTFVRVDPIRQRSLEIQKRHSDHMKYSHAKKKKI